MALSLKDPETDRLARAVARLTGESLTEAVRTVLAERLEREQRRRGKPIDWGRVRQVQARVARRPLVDDRPADDLLGYDEDGLPR